MTSKQSFDDTHGHSIKFDITIWLDVPLTPSAVKEIHDKLEAEAKRLGEAEQEYRLRELLINKHGILTDGSPAE